MDPRDFCNWFQGVLDFAVNEDGTAAFTKIQAARIQTKLTETAETAAKYDAAGAGPAARC